MFTSLAWTVRWSTFTSVAALLFAVCSVESAPAQTQWATAPNGTDIYNTNSGFVGIRTANPRAFLHVFGPANTDVYATFGPDPTIGPALNLGAGGTSFGAGATFMNARGSSGTLRLMTNSLDGLFIDSSQRVGIGTTTPATKLHVVGDLTVTGNIAAKYQDIAEWVPTSQTLISGTVVVLDVEKHNRVIASHISYDTRVAGVVSDTPGVILGEAGEGKVKVATTGRVRVRVDATRGAIGVGDLLVTSDREGLAMRSKPLDLYGTPIHRPGTLIGKALEPLDKGIGEILVLLSLQ